jgi:uncharacterized protein (TIGR03083 family)
MTTTGSATGTTTTTGTTTGSATGGGATDGASASSPSASSPAALYADVRLRISDLVRDLPADRASTPVPGCPGWSVHDVIAHATGIVADVTAGNLDGATTDPWTQAQVEMRRDVPLADVLDEWAKLAATFEPSLDTLPKAITRTLTIDLVTHEHDIRGALREPGGRDSEAYAIARKGYAVALAKSIEERGLPGLRLRADDWQFDAGPDPDTEVRTKDSFELFRALAGRRGRNQVLGYDWSAEPAPYLPVLNHFGPLPEADVVEG